MPIKLPASLVEYLLLGPTGDRRLLQDSPILGDVWAAFADDPTAPQELLITPHREQPAVLVASQLDDLVEARRREQLREQPANIASLHGIVAARLYFDEVVSLLVPRTSWADTPRIKQQIHDSEQIPSTRPEVIHATLRTMVRHWSDPEANRRPRERLSTFQRYVALAGLIRWAADRPEPTPSTGVSRNAAIAKAIGDDGRLRDEFQRIVQYVVNAAVPTVLFYQLALNRQALMAIARSVPAIKGDAARGLFTVNCEKIAWAVLDCGINGKHMAFEDADGNSRVKRSFDFTNVRKIVSLDNLRVFGKGGNALERRQVLDLLLHDDLRIRPTDQDAARDLYDLAVDLKKLRPPNWAVIEKFVEIGVGTSVEVSDHGTHVAGIIGARKPTAERAQARKISAGRQKDYADGMCPDIKLYDFRVLGRRPQDTEFAIIAALQFIRYLNEPRPLRDDPRRQSQPVDSARRAEFRLRPHADLRRMRAAGRTAASWSSPRPAIAAIRASRPRRARTRATRPSASPIPATPRRDHGRRHPSLLAAHLRRELLLEPRADRRRTPQAGPGRARRTDSCAARPAITGDDLDGTSMAAPHVSGAAAMLMARYPELIGQPRRIKTILCESATDLGRERSFQGHGMLDVLRAFQSI